MDIPEKFAEIFLGNVFASIATVMKDGSPHVVPVWVGYDGECLITAGGKEHLRHTNMKRDSRVALTISTPDDPYEVYLVRGNVIEMLDSGGVEFLDKEAQRRWGIEEYPFQREKDRYLVRILPKSIIDTSSIVPGGGK
jgi:predicted pyridoxine 5'-phosphate oxidase superfamily flavin-nucleotide-binding protein